MPRDILPPPVRPTRSEPKMEEDSPRTMLRRIAQARSPGSDDPKRQSASLVISALQNLVQAGDLNPELRPIVSRIVMMFRDISSSGAPSPSPAPPEGPRPGPESEPSPAPET